MSSNNTPPPFNLPTVDASRPVDERLLAKLIEERPLLYDYCMRMTAQMNRSFEATEEVINVLSRSYDYEDSFSAVRVTMYKMARSFCSDIWNANTGNLVNEGFEAAVIPTGLVLPVLEKLDRCLNSLEGFERELIILRLRIGFTSQEIQEILDTDQSCERNYESLSDEIAKQFPSLANHLEKAIHSLPFHPQPTLSRHDTQALSMLIQDFHGKSGSNVAKVLKYFAIGIIIFIVIWLVKDYV